MAIYLICVFISFLVFLNHKKFFSYLGVFDYPDEDRKIHKKPISLSGSIFLILNVTAFLFYVFFFNESDYLNIFSKKRELFFIFFSLFGLYALGYLDDKFNINPWTKLAATSFFLLALMLADNLLIIEILYFKFPNHIVQVTLDNLSIFFTLICFIAYLNAVNMFDGINLQIGSYSLIISTYFITQNIFSELNIILVISLIPFLILNFQNKVFIGNSGASIIAFLYGFQFIKGYNTGIIEIDEIIILNYIISLDLIRVFILRITKGKNPLVADKSHIHHLLIKKFNHTKVILISILLLILPIALSLIFSNNWFILSVFIIFYFILIYSLRKSDKSV